MSRPDPLFRAELSHEFAPGYYRSGKTTTNMKSRSGRGIRVFHVRQRHALQEIPIGPELMTGESRQHSHAPDARI